MILEIETEYEIHDLVWVSSHFYSKERKGVITGLKIKVNSWNEIEVEYQVSYTGMVTTFTSDEIRKRGSK